MEILYGKPVVDALDEQSNTLMLQKKNKPVLAIIRVGNNESDLSYLRSAIKKCEKFIIEVKEYNFDNEVTQQELVDCIHTINKDDSISGVLMFRPLPKTVDEAYICEQLDPKKDVDGITSTSMAHIYGNGNQGYYPCTAQGVVEMLKYYQPDLQGKNVCIIGRSLVIGKPVSMLLLKENCTVTVCHSKTKDLPEVTKKADIVVVAIGRCEMVDASYFKEGQTVIDVGINYSESKQKIVGDVDFDSASQVVDRLSPVPKGVGALTTSILIRHVIEATK